MQSIRDAVNLGANFPSLRLQVLHQRAQVTRLLQLLPELLQLNREKRHSLIQVIVEFTSDAFALLFLRVDEQATQVAERLSCAVMQVLICVQFLTSLLGRWHQIVSYQNAESAGQVEPRRMNQSPAMPI